MKAERKEIEATKGNWWDITHPPPENDSRPYDLYGSKNIRTDVFTDHNEPQKDLQIWVF